MTVAELIDELQKHAPDTVVMVQHFGLAWRPAKLVKMAGTEYGLEPIGKRKVATVAS